MNKEDVVSQFLAAMRKAGLEPDCLIVGDGKLHRFRDWLDQQGSESGWYILFCDHPAGGAFGCRLQGIIGSWTQNSECINAS